jgi:hypothetical protein
VEFRDLRGVLAGRDLPEDIKTRLLSQHEETVQLQAQIQNLNDKLVKAKQVRAGAFTSSSPSFSHVRTVHQAARQALQGGVWVEVWRACRGDGTRIPCNQPYTL